MHVIIFFIYIFTLKLKIIDINLSIIVFLLSIPYLINYQKKLKISKETGYILLFYLLIGVVFLISPILNDSGEFILFRFNIISFIEAFIGSYLLIKYLIKKEENILDVISKVCFIQGIFVLFFYFLPQVRNFLLLEVFEFNSNFDITNKSFFRGVGLGGAGANLSTIQAIGFLCSIRNIKSNQYKIFSIIILGSVILLGRTGLIFIIGVLGMFIFLSYKKKYSLKIVIGMIATIIIIFLIYSISNKYNFKVNKLFEHSFEVVINFIKGNGFKSSSSDKLKEMVFFPKTLKTLIMGDGKYQLLNGKNYMNTDSGYIRMIFFSGIIGALIFYSFILFIASKILSRINGSLKKYIFCIITLLFFIEIKEPFFLYINIQKIYFLIYWYLRKNKQKLYERRN